MASGFKIVEEAPYLGDLEMELGGDCLGRDRE
jgi:hypothetical protein